VPCDYLYLVRTMASSKVQSTIFNLLLLLLLCRCWSLRFFFVRPSVRSPTKIYYDFFRRHDLNFEFLRPKK
jgi:hypothetical protein